MFNSAAFFSDSCVAHLLGQDGFNALFEVAAVLPGCQTPSAGHILPLVLQHASQLSRKGRGEHEENTKARLRPLPQRAAVTYSST
jgi:hypothetical protein